MAKKKKSLSEAVSSEIKASFNLDSFKNKKDYHQKQSLKNKFGSHYPMLIKR